MLKKKFIIGFERKNEFIFTSYIIMNYETECPNCEKISFVKECSECSVEICDDCEDPEYNMCSECRKLLESKSIKSYVFE